MRKFILYSLFSLACLALAGCAGDGREEREPANALLLEGLMAGAMADCTNRLAAGEFTTHVERARCEGVEARGSVEGLGMEYAFGDLVALLSEWRLRLARERDARTLDAAGERARQTEFDAAFLREMDTRERLHNSEVPAIGFNICEIERYGLRCTQVDTVSLENEYNAADADCERKRSMDFFKNIEAGARCLFLEGMVPVHGRNNFPHMELVRLFAEYMVNLPKRWTEKRITTAKFKQYSKAFLEQYLDEIERRDQLRAAGDLNWRRRDCRVENDHLICEPAEHASALFLTHEGNSQG